MRYFEPITKGQNKGLTFLEYMIGNYWFYLAICTSTSLGFYVYSVMMDEPEAITGTIAFGCLNVIAVVITIVDWGIKKKRWEY